MAPGTSAPQPGQIEAFAREHLTAYMVPREFRFFESLPRTVSMKICRPELKTMLGIP
jgi:long-chain acyl-CoA synthetase